MFVCLFVYTTAAAVKSLINNNKREQSLGCSVHYKEHEIDSVLYNDNAHTRMFDTHCFASLLLI